MEDPALLKYPDKSSYATSQGYLNNLNADHNDALQSIQRWVISRHVQINSLSSSILHPTLLLLRYLRANNFSVEKTITHLETNMKVEVFTLLKIAY